MLDLLIEIWSNPTLFYQKRMNRRNLSKWYKSTSGNFCKCSRGPTGVFDSYTWSLVSGFISLYSIFWLTFVWKIGEIINSAVAAVSFAEVCNVPERWSWNLFTRAKHVHKMLVRKYNLTQTKTNARFLSTFVQDLEIINEPTFLLNRIYYECATAMDVKKFEGLMKSQYWQFVIPTFLFSIGLRIYIKTFSMSFFKMWLPRKHYFYVKFLFFVLDNITCIDIVMRCLSTYNQMVLDFDDDIAIVL